MRLLCFLVLLVMNVNIYGQEGVIFPGLEGTELAVALQEAYRPWEVLSYSQARDTMYLVIDRKQDSIYCAYTGYAHHLPDGYDPSKYIFDDGQETGINCEHLWPQSKGTKTGYAKSDMHHLLPVRAVVNQARGNLPFGEVDDEAATHWYYRDQNERQPPVASGRDLYSELGQGNFEPPEELKGDIARAVFYVYVMYNDQVDVSFLADQLFTLRSWHATDPPDAREKARSRKIGEYQNGKANPFVLDASLVERLWTR